MEFESEECDYDIYGDTRNRKGKKEEGYTSHNKGYKEQKRIYYVKQKRLAQSLADREISEEEYNEEENKKSNKRQLKYTADEEDENYGKTPLEQFLSDYYIPGNATGKYKEETSPVYLDLFECTIK